MKNYKYLPLLLVSLGIIFSLTSCRHHCTKGSGVQKTEKRKVEAFQKISISGAYKVVLKQDSSFALQVTADDNLLPLIKTEVSGGRLHIYNKKAICSSRQMVVTVGVGRLEEIKSSGGIEVSGDGKLTTGDIRLNLAGATKLTLNLTAGNVITEGSGATELNLTGQATSHSIDLSGSGNVKAVNFIVGDCSIQTSGVGHVEVNVLKTLNINSSGASEIKYKGNPSVTQTKAGLSSVEKIN